MLNKFFLSFFCISCFCYYSSGQTLEGKIVDANTKNVLSGSILIKEVSTPSIIKEFVLVKEGSFSFKLKKEYDTILLDVQSLGYSTYEETINFPKTDTTYTFLFELIKEKITNLDEVYITAKNRPYKIKEDTIVYKVDRYKDGSERKIEDIIKKIPGVDINEQSGLIKFNGKPIETVTLEGDNLFGHNYSLGTKNINVDMVEEIQAIENYSENPLLKDIEQSDEVVLNLVLKKDRIDISGNIDIGSGVSDDSSVPTNINTNLLGVTKKYKSFAIGTFNNIGENISPFDYFGFNFNVEQLNEEEYFARKIIPETQFLNTLDEKRVNLNNQLFANYNAIFNIDNRFKVKTNLYFLNDKISSNQLFENQFDIDNVSFNTADKIEIDKKPTQHRGDVEIRYNTSKNSLLQYSIRVRQENILTNNNILFNQESSFLSVLDSEDFLFKQNIVFTKKLLKKKAVQILASHSSNDIPQTYDLTTPSNMNSTIYDNRKQSNSFNKQVFKLESVILGAKKKNKYSFSVGGNHIINRFNSNLLNIYTNGIIDNVNTNNAKYSNSSVYSLGNYHWNLGKLRISTNYSLRYLSQRLESIVDSDTEESGKFLFEPTINILYKINRISNLTINAGYNFHTISDQHFFLNPVLINNRTSISNIPSLNLQRAQTYSMAYYNNDLFNQFQLQIDLNYTKQKGSFVSNSLISESETQLQYLFLNENTETLNTNLKVSKYIPFFKSTIKWSSMYSNNKYKNGVNFSDLRSNESSLFNNKFFLKTSLDLPLNFENEINLISSVTKTEDDLEFMNNSLNNSFRIIFKPIKSLSGTFSADYYLPNTKVKNENYLFLDTRFDYKPKDKNWELSFTAQNITNENIFQQIHTTDVSINLYRNNILPRFFLINFRYEF